MAVKIKSGRYPGVVIILFIVSVLVLLFFNPWHSPRREKRQILLGDPGQIDQIRITGPGSSVILGKSGETWKLSGGKSANQLAIENLLFAAERLQVDAVQTDFSAVDKEALKEVSFLSKEKLVLQYQTVSREGRFMILPGGSERAYAVSLPGYPELELNQVFSDLESHYSDHILIELLPGEIRQIEVEKRGNPPFRFTSDNAGEMSCFLPLSDSLVPMEGIDEESVRMLFTYFTSIRYEEKAGEQLYTLTKEEMDERWLADISLESNEGEKHSLQVYSLPGENEKKEHMFLALVIHNGSPEPLLVNYIYLDVIMRAFPAYFGDNSLRH
jgi:hypothetical protein